MPRARDSCIFERRSLRLEIMIRNRTYALIRKGLILDPTRGECGAGDESDPARTADPEATRHILWPMAKAFPGSEPLFRPAGMGIRNHFRGSIRG